MATTDLPEGYREGATVPFEIALVVDDVLLTGTFNDRTLVRWDATTFEELGREQLGKTDQFPPNLQSLFPGSEGVWVTLAFDHAVALLDPSTGEFTRRIELPGRPYDVFEADGELWIADYEWGTVTRYDLATDRVVTVIYALQSPTDIIMADGSIWVPSHQGRAAPEEPLTLGGYVRRIDPATNAVVASPKVGPRPYYLAAGFGGVWTGTATGGSVDRVDTTTGEVTTIWIGEDGAFDIEAIGDSIWAAVEWQWPPDRGCNPRTSYIVRIDPTTNTMRERVGFPCPTAITPAGDGFWVSGRDGDTVLSTYFERVE